MLKLIQSSFLSLDRQLIRKMRSLSVKARLFLMVVIISLLPILVIGVITYMQSDRDIVSKISISSLQLVKQIGANINSKLLSWEQYSDIIAVSEDVQEILRKYENMDPKEAYIVTRELEKIMKETLKVSLDIQEPDLITSNGTVISPNTNSSPFVNNMEKSELERLKKMSLDARGSYIWYTDEILRRVYSGYIILSRSITDINTFQGTLGYLMLQIDGNYLYDLYENVDLGDGSRVYVIDTHYNIVLSEDKGEIGTIFYPQISDEMIQLYQQGFTNHTIKNTELKYLAAFSKIQESGWTVVALIPDAYLSSLSNNIGKTVLVVGFICLIISFLFFVTIYRSISTPLDHLMLSMQEVEQGNLNPRKLSDDANDEVAAVTGSYNKMIYELVKMIQNIKLKEKQKAEAEFRALQAQINPHFIANTLLNVSWLAKIQKAENIEVLVVSLIQLLNASMGRGEDIISIEEEIRNINSYIRIQEYKYYKKLKVYLDIEQDILQYKILKFILQPVMENAIIHGIGPKQGEGIMTIKGYRDDRRIMITVTDTGVGMDVDEIASMLDKEVRSKEQFSSIGLKNVQERIVLSYGKEYGIRIKSEKGMFTSVEIRLPVLE